MKNRRTLIKLAISFLLLSILLAFFVYELPVYVKYKLPDIIAKKTGRKASVETLKLSLFPVAVQINNAAIAETDGKTFAGLESFYCQFNTWQSLKQITLVIDKVIVAKPYIRIVKNKNGGFNFDSFIKNKTEPAQPEDSSLLPVSIGELSITDGKLSFEDNQINLQSKADITPVKLNIYNLSTLTNQKFQLDLTLALSLGGSLSWQAEGSINPFVSNGHIKLEKLQLDKLLSLAFPSNNAFSLTGSFACTSDYQLIYYNNRLSLRTARLKTDVLNFQYNDKRANPLQIRLTNFSHSTDLKLIKRADIFKIRSDKSNIAFSDIDFSGFSQNKIEMKLKHFNNSADFKVEQLKDAWQFVSIQNKIDLTGIQLNRSGEMFTSKQLSMETSINGDFKPDDWRLSVNQSKLAVNSITMANAKLQIALKSFALQWGLESHYAKKRLTLVVNKANLDSKQLTLTEQGNSKELIKISSIGLNNLGIDLSGKQLTIDSVTLDNADVYAWLTKNRELNYQSLFSSVLLPPTSKETSPAGKTLPWGINIKNLLFSNLGLDFEDQTQKKPLIVNFRPINLKLYGFNIKSPGKLPLSLTVSINKTGSLKIDGTIVADPMAAELSIAVDTFDLDIFQQYLNQFVRVDIIDGELDIDGKISVAKISDKLAVKFTGNSKISNFLTRDQKQHKDLVKWHKLMLENFAADFAENRFTASSLTLDKPFVRFIINKNKTVNFADLIITRQKQSEPVDIKLAPATDRKNQYFQIEKFQVIDGSSDFADNSLILPFAAQIKSLRGTANDISSDKKALIKMFLTGNVYDLSPVEIEGSISPFLRNYDIKMNFKDMPLPLMSPYMVQFAGYKIEKGKINLGLKYKVENKKLTASNSIFINQFELGEKVNNPNAVSLPLKLATALLKDSNGNIKIDIPITGSLEDPKFSIGGIVKEALLKVLNKVVTAPFYALASLLGSSKDLSTIDFAAGSAILTNDQQKKLDSLAKALKQRSELNLDIKGIVYEEQDCPAIREMALYDRIKRHRADEINAKGGKKILPEYVELDNHNYKRLLANYFIKKFPELGKRSILGNPELINNKDNDFYTVAKQKLSGAMKIEEYRLKDLATARARAIANYLVNNDGVKNDRIYLLDTLIKPKAEDQGIVCIMALHAN